MTLFNARDQSIVFNCSLSKPNGSPALISAIVSPFRQSSASRKYKHYGLFGPPSHSVPKVSFWHQAALHSIKFDPPKQTFNTGRTWHISDYKPQRVQRTLQ